MTDDYYWGSGFNQGELRIGDDIARTSSTTLKGDHYFWFDGINKFRLKLSIKLQEFCIFIV